MRDQSLTKLASRSAAVFLIGWAFQMFGGIWVSALNGSHMTTEQAIRWSAVSLAVGVLLWVLPWERWNPRATIAIGIIIVPVCAAIAWDTKFAAGRDTPSPDSAFFIILAWVGVTQRRWVPLLFAPYIGIVYGGVLVLTPDTRESTSSMITVIVLAALLGEVVAWMKETVTRAQLLERQRLMDVETLTSTLSRLRGVPIDEAAETIAEATLRVHRCRDVRVVLRGISAERALTTFGTDGRVSLHDGNELLALADPSPAGRVLVEPIDADGRRQRLAITLVTPKDEVAGIVVAELAEPPDDFTRHLSRLFATEVGTAVEQVEQVDALEQKALFDELTGVGNRRWAMELLNDLEAGDAVMLIDIDDFKQINDTSGHATGDEVLKALGRHMRTTMGDAEAVARYGGDEFLVVNKARFGDPLEAANKIHASWLGAGPKATISIGVAIHPGDARPDATLEQADVALYSSKQHGRNRVILYREDEMAGVEAPSAIGAGRAANRARAAREPVLDGNPRDGD